MDIQLRSVKGIGPARLKSLAACGIETVRRLLFYLPRGYKDLTDVKPLDTLYAGDMAAVRVWVVGTVSTVRVKNLTITKARVQDNSGQMPAVWYNQPYVKQTLKQDQEYLLYGRVEARSGSIQLTCPTIEREAIIRPIYKPMPGLSSGVIEKCVDAALQAAEGQWAESLPESIRRAHGLCELNFAMRNVHKPVSLSALAAASRRLAFEDGLFYLVGLWLLRGSGGKGVKIDCAAEDADAIWSRMPFSPTGAQLRVVREIANDLRGEYPMARMVQGDVGCGKTAVAFCALYLAAANGWQGVMMAPTEILAQQHYDSAIRCFSELNLNVGLLTGSMTQKQHREAHEKIASGEWQIVIGTHALITPAVSYLRLGLVITDEQHRFGVRQRSALSGKGENPNVLVMSATPIPRTLSLVLYGDLDLSIIDELPPGRIPVRTRIVPENKRAGMYEFLRKEVRAGRQIYVVCPLVSESEAIDASSAEEVYEHLKKHALKDLNIGLLHGQMSALDKENTLGAFYEKRIDVLVSTTVIEVGVNVPNASVMVVENAERFGLSQLHQLRGRVGRGADAAWCFLMAEPSEKLRIMTETTDGFVIAQKDLELRGAGEIFGVRQSGESQSPLMAINDARLLKEIHDTARSLLKNASSEDSRRVIIAAQEMLKKKFEEIAMN